MKNSRRGPLLLDRLRQTAVALAFCALILVVPQSALAQTFNVLFSFSGPTTGLYPVSGVTVDRAGNLYGTTTEGGATGGGVVFEVTP